MVTKHNAVTQTSHGREYAHGGFIEEGAVACCGSCAEQQKHGHTHGDACDDGHSHAHGQTEASSLVRTWLPLGIGAVLFALPFVSALPPWAFYAALGLGYAVLGAPILWQAVKNIARGEIFDENFLMGIASIGAWCIGEAPEAVGVMLFYRVGEALQDHAVDRSQRTINQMVGITPDEAHLLQGDVEQTVPAGDIPVGALIRIKAMERVPLDCVVETGAGEVDTSSLTGESQPRAFAPGDALLSGMINGNAVITARTTAAYQDSTAMRILHLMRQTAANKAPMQQFITRFAKVYTPIVVAVAAVIAIGVPLIGGLPWSDWIYRGLVFLVVSCPCAMVVSVPLAFFAGLGKSSKNGLVVRGGNMLDALGRAGVLVMDKTGTLTTGTFTVQEISTQDGLPEQELLRLAAQCEVQSSHAIARSIVQSARQRGLRIEDSAQIAEELPGRGVRVEQGGEAILCGNGLFMQENGIGLPAQADVQWTLVYVARAGKYLGYIGLGDTIRDGAKEFVAQVHKKGICTVMLTGDHPAQAAQVADTLGIDQVHAGLLPADKVRRVEEMHQQLGNGKTTVFVGDGINDAPVLIAADVGVAMGGIGSDAAIEAADAVLVSDDMRGLGAAFGVAQKTRNLVVQDIVFALAVKVGIMALGVFGLTDLWWAVFADVGVTLLCVLNSLR